MREESTVKSLVVCGIPITTYNHVPHESEVEVKFDGKVYNGFYVSYNNHDRAIYGDVTTALVLGQMQKFFILNGNHTEQYGKLIEQGFHKCLEYFRSNEDKINKYSD